MVFPVAVMSAATTLFVPVWVRVTVWLPTEVSVLLDGSSVALTVLSRGTFDSPLAGETLETVSLSMSGPPSRSQAAKLSTRRDKRPPLRIIAHLLLAPITEVRAVGMKLALYKVLHGVLSFFLDLLIDLWEHTRILNVQSCSNAWVAPLPLHLKLLSL